MNNLRHRPTRIAGCIFGITVFLVLTGSAMVLPPNPDNAALLYFQAFLARPEADKHTEDILHAVLRGARPSEPLMEYIDRCRSAIEYADSGSRIPECNWGLQLSEGNDVPSQLAVQMRSLAFVLGADARVLLSGGRWRAALDRCLTMRRFAHHIGDDTLLLYAVAVGIDSLAMRCISDVLGSLPASAATLRRLDNELIASHKPTPDLAKALIMDFELVLRRIALRPETVKWLREARAGTGQDVPAGSRLGGATDEQLVNGVRSEYGDTLNRVCRIIESEMPYQEAFARIQRLADRLREESSSNRAVSVVCKSTYGSDFLPKYDLHVRYLANYSALRTALAIYLVKAEAGRLPDALPEDVPSDPYTGDDFKYERTEDGFVLRGGSKNGRVDQLKEYAFEVE